MIPRVPSLVVSFKKFPWSSKGAMPNNLFVMAKVPSWLFPSRNSLEVLRVPCHLPFKHSMATRGKYRCNDRDPIISYVSCYSDTNGVRDQRIHIDACPPMKSSWVTQLWDLPSSHHDLQSEGGSTFPAQVMVAVLVGEIRDIIPPLPCNYIHFVQPHHSYVRHSAKQLICACNH